VRKFKTAFEGEVDLDDPKTYDYLPDNLNDLDNLMFKEIGKALCYMKYFHPEIYKSKKLYGPQQKKRVENLIKYFCNNRTNHYDDILWLKEQVFLFQEETENMC
jgi:hypothetical protein